MRWRQLSLVMGLLSFAAVLSAQERSTPAPILAKALADGTATLAPAVPGQKQPATYGTTVTSYYRVSAQEFLPYTSSITYSDAGGGTTAFLRYPTAGSDFLATLHLPSGALLTSLEVDYCNSNATQPLLAGPFGCDYHGQNCVPLTATMSGPASTGCTFVTADLTPANWTMDNNFNEVVLIMEPGANDGSISFAGMIVGYLLQVSPAPGSATFPDVPTSDFGFQYIEALVASGITGGCGGGNYCPDNFVTRRQMAIFLAKALGLQFQ